MKYLCGRMQHWQKKIYIGQTSDCSPYLTCKKRTEMLDYVLTSLKTQEVNLKNMIAHPETFESTYLNSIYKLESVVPDLIKTVTKLLDLSKVQTSIS